jgi:hypothetical protein
MLRVSLTTDAFFLFFVLSPSHSLLQRPLVPFIYSYACHPHTTVLYPTVVINSVELRAGYSCADPRCTVPHSNAAHLTTRRGMFENSTVFDV